MKRCILSLLITVPLMAVEVPEAKLRGFSPLPEVMDSKVNPITPAKVELGRILYFENRLSKSQKFSCNSCHDLAKYGMDGEATSGGHKNQRGDRNSPTVYNAAGHVAQFWDGRAATVEDQAKGPILNPVEMALASPEQAVLVLKSIPGYADLFKKAFPGDKDPITYDNAANAIGAFERKLVTPSRWDKFLRGDKAALTADEKAGFVKFVDSGCATCHMGAYVGGTVFQKVGLAKPWPDSHDPGRFKVTNNEADRMMFKAPSLRNIDKTAPYFHSGKIVTLPEAVSMMGEYQLGRRLDANEVKSIITWLKTLTGDLPVEYIKAPKLPLGSAKTPKPDMM